MPSGSFSRVMDVADVKGFRRAIGQAVDDVLMALWGIVEDDEFAAVCRVILIAVHIEQVRQEMRRGSGVGVTTLTNGFSRWVLSVLMMVGVGMVFG